MQLLKARLAEEQSENQEAAAEATAQRQALPAAQEAVGDAQAAAQPSSKVSQACACRLRHLCVQWFGHDCVTFGVLDILWTVMLHPSMLSRLEKRSSNRHAGRLPFLSCTTLHDMAWHAIVLLHCCQPGLCLCLLCNEPQQQSCPNPAS